ncbi:MAG: hypothetical protein Q4G68_11030 [Planctomycetia bacterium]|nr:hypothetical protein [Planctomycetia bacterium]
MNLYWQTWQIIILFFSFIIVGWCDDTSDFPPDHFSKPVPPTLETPPISCWKEVLDPIEKAEVFMFLYQAGSGNYAKIKFWDAVYNVVLDSTYVKENATVHFLIDTTRDSLLSWRFQAINYIDHLETKNLPPGASFHSIYTPDRTYTLTGLAKSSGGSPVETPGYIMHDQRKVRVVSPSTISTSPLNQQGDPRFFFTLANPCVANVYWKEYPVIASCLRGEKTETLRETINAEYKIYDYIDDANVWYKIETWLPNRQRMLRATIFSGQSGFLPVRHIEATNYTPPFLTEVLLEWQNQNEEVFIPKTYSILSQFGKSLIKYNLDESKINSPLPKNCFSWQGLGLENGDLILNDMEQQVYIVQKNGNLKILCQYGKEPLKDTKSFFSWMRIFLFLVGLIVIFYSVSIKIKQRTTLMSFK